MLTLEQRQCTEDEERTRRDPNSQGQEGYGDRPERSSGRKKEPLKCRLRMW